MEIVIDVSLPILDQFSSQLEISAKDGKVHLDDARGKGTIRLLYLPPQLELLHFDFQLKQVLTIHSQNPLSSTWYLLNTNLSEQAIEKEVNDQAFNFQRYLPSGMLFYTPGTKVFSSSPTGIRFQIVLIRFNKLFLHTYAETELEVLSASEQSVIYEDLDYESERLLRKAIRTESKPILVHSQVLSFLTLFFDKLGRRSRGNSYEHVHPTDLKGLFVASAYLRDPLSDHSPGIEELSKLAGMGTTKFKTTFKQVFGTSPMQYQRKIRMEYARDQILAKKSTPSEVSYAIGYSHPSKFSAAFKKYFGHLPSEV